MDKKVYLECSCHSIEHITRFSYSQIEPHEVYMETHLYNYMGFWKRIWVAIKYIFGYRSRYGDFDCLILSPPAVVNMRDSFNTFLKENDQYEKNQ